MTQPATAPTKPSILSRPAVIAMGYFLLLAILIGYFWSSGPSKILAAMGTPIPTVLPRPTLAVTAPAGPSAPAPRDDAQIQNLIDWAERTNQSAADSISSANTVLGAVQGLGVLISIVTGLIAVAAGAAGLFGLRRLSKLDQELDKRTEALDAQLNALEPYLPLLTDFNTKAKQLAVLEKRIEDEVVRLKKESTDSLEASALLQIGLKEFGYGNRKVAIEKIRKAHALDKTNRAINYSLGELLIRANEDVLLREGIKLLKDVHKQDEEERKLNEEARKQRELLIRDAKDMLPREGIKVVEDIHKPDEEDGQDPSVNAAIGYAYRVLGDLELDKFPEAERLVQSKSNRNYTKALIHYLRAKQNSDEFLRDITGESVFGGLAGLFKRCGELDNALEWYEKIAKTTPGSSYPVINIALIYDQQKKYDDANTKFQKARKIAKRNFDLVDSDHFAAFDVVTASVALNDGTEAHEYLTKALDLDPSVHNLKKLEDSLQAMPYVEDRQKLRLDILSRIRQHRETRGQ